MGEKLTDQTVAQFLDALASSAPAPGGGSAAALSGALGAALVSMVCNLTVGKKNYADVQDEIGALVKQSEDLRRKLSEINELVAMVKEALPRMERLELPPEERKTGGM